MEYVVNISPKMKAVSRTLRETFEGMDFCVSEKGRNLVLEVPKANCEEVVDFLHRHYEDVVSIKKAYPMIEDLHDFILVKPLVTEAPFFDVYDVPVPELEKRLVDTASDKEYAAQSDGAIQKEYQRAFELFDVNKSSLLRYAARKGKKEEVLERIQRLDTQRVETVKAIQHYFSGTPVHKAWLFGSYSRMEEGPGSDIDLLVKLDPGHRLGLMGFSHLITDLQALVHRPIDLVAEESLKPFARENVEKDKILIYERAS